MRIPYHRPLARLVIVLLLGTVATHAAAQEAPEDRKRAFQGQDDNVFPEFPDPAPDAPTARLRMVFDLVSGAQELSVEPLQPFEVLVVAYDAQIPIRAWEATLVIDPRLRVLERDIPANVNVGQGDEVSAAVKPRDCFTDNPAVLARLKLMVMEEGLTDLVLGLGPVARPSIPTVPTDLEGPTPVYLTCIPELDMRPFDYCKTCAVVNPVSVRPEVDAKPDDPLRGILAPVRGRG